MAESTQWDYKLLDTWSGDEEIAPKLFQLGNDKWELAGQLACGDGATSKLIFKRPKQPSQDYGYSR